MMPKYFLIVCLCFCTFLCKAQVSSLKDLEACISRSAVRVGDSLVGKGWKLDIAMTGNFENDYYRTFSFGNLKTDPTRALAWLRIHNTESAVNRVYYQAPDKAAYTLLLKEIEALQPDKSDGQIVDNQILTIYSTKKFIYQSIVTSTSYTIAVIAPSYFQDQTQNP
nr:hypothetical protein [Pedobacter sp. ASV19]